MYIPLLVSEIPTEFAPSPRPEQEPKDRSLAGKKRRLLAAFVSGLIPGTGQLLLRQRRIATFFLLAFAVVLVLYWPLRLPGYWWGLLLLVWIELLLGLASSCVSLVARSDSYSKLSLWWLVLFVPSSLLGCFAFSNLSLRAAGFRIYDIPSTAMEQTLVRGDRIVADLRSYDSHEPSAGDIVLFRREGTIFVKRAIATSGSTVTGRNGLAFVNGTQLDEPYIEHIGNVPEKLNNFGPITVPVGKLFVMGDNRDVSYDSRMPEFGFVDITTVVGKPLYIYRSTRDRVGPKLK